VQFEMALFGADHSDASYLDVPTAAARLAE
jgi:hypothetical protein